MTRLEHIRLAVRLAVQPNAAGARPRSKLADDAVQPVYILTARGGGYRMGKPDL